MMVIGPSKNLVTTSILITSICYYTRDGIGAEGVLSPPRKT
jgi:hypothetical protein